MWIGGSDGGYSDSNSSKELGSFGCAKSFALRVHNDNREESWRIGKYGQIYYSF